ncbi:MAG: acyltransferase [Myxococcota bacterium]
MLPAHPPQHAAPDSQAPSSARLAGLDVLRALAILLVILHHYRWLPGCPTWLRWFALRGSVGVDVFFVLSGWLVGGQLLRSVRRSGAVPWTSFWLRRWLRTLPPYYVCLLGLCLLGEVPTTHLPALGLFLQNYLAPSDWLISWSLCVEEHFYLLLPVVVFLLVKLGRWRREAVFVLVGALFLLSPVMRAWAQPEMAKGSYNAFLGSFYVPTHLRLEGLVLGVALAAAHEWRVAAWRWLEQRAGLCAAVGATMAVLATWNPWVTGWTADGRERMAFFASVPAFTLVSLGVALMIPWCLTVGRTARLVWATFLAEHAYTLYLTHETVGDLVRRELRGHGLGFGVLLVVAVLGSLGVSVALRRLVEEPVLRLRDRWLRARARPDHDVTGTSAAA